MKEAIAILTGGGPAPGMNTVVGSVAKTFLRKGYRVIGLHEGYTGLFNPSPRMVDIDYLMADGIFNQGGSFLQMSRFKPKDSDFENNFNLKFFTDNNVKLLVTVGGDDTASTANRIAKFLEAKKYPIANIHVPKTIDNDLPLPKGTPTFGYESAKDKGAVIARAVYVDARTSGNWFVLAAMGRSAGHLAFGIGEACHYPMIVIPEMFDKTEITVEKIVNLVISSIIKRKIMGMDYGAAVISEGVFHALSDEEIRKSGIHFTYDEHGHPELGKVSKAHIFNEMIEKKLKEIGAYDKTIVQLLAAALVMVPYCALAGERFTAETFQPVSLACLLVLGMFHTGFAYALYFGSMKALRAQTIAIFSYIDPVIAIILSVTVLHEPFSILSAVGSVLILGAAFASEKS